MKVYEQMKKKVKRSWKLTKACLIISRTNKKLLVFPILSVLAFSILISIMSYWILRFYPTWCPEQNYKSATEAAAAEQAAFSKVVFGKPLNTLFFFSLYLIGSFAAIFFNAAFIHCLLSSLEGNKSTLRDGFRASFKHIRSIFFWALFAATIKIIINCADKCVNSIRHIPWIGNRIASVAWAFTTYFVVPILVYENLSIKGAIKRSAQLLRRTWGEMTAFSVGAWLFLTIILVVSLLAVLLLGRLCMPIIPSALQDIFVSLLYISTIAILPPFFLVGLFIQWSYETVLYSYAITGMLPSEFPKELVPFRKETQ